MWKRLFFCNLSFTNNTTPNGDIQLVQKNYSPAFLPGLVTYVYTFFLCISGSFVNLLFCSFCLWFCDSFRQIFQHHSTSYSDRMQLVSVDKFRQVFHKNFHFPLDFTPILAYNTIKDKERDSEISIHIPLTGYDGLAFHVRFSEISFQSTYPSRGMTSSAFRIPYFQRYFNPNTPHGE